jgi:hypothetical protein
MTAEDGQCERKRSDMTPCVIEDGPMALADVGVCVGCGFRPAPAQPDDDAQFVTLPVRSIDVRNAEIDRLRDEVATLRHERTLLIEWGRRILARADSMPAGRYPTSAEVIAAAGLPIE